MKEIERLQGAWQKVSALGSFDTSQRPWWWDLRQAVERYL